MGPWGTCYTAGDAVATALASFVIGIAAVKTVTRMDGSTIDVPEWHWIFWIAAFTLVVITAIVMILFRNKPEDVGLPDITTYHRQAREQTEASKSSNIELWKNTKDVLSRGPVWVLGLTYFGIKFIRYMFMLWLPTYLSDVRNFDYDIAGYNAVFLSIAGVLGTFIASWLSDTVFRSRRAPISVIMLLGLACSIYFFGIAPVSLIPIAVAMVGFLTYGPDFVVSAVAVMDFGSRKGASTAAGFVNGMGSIGAAIMPTIVGLVEMLWGWGAVFYLLIIFSLICAGLMATMWNKVGTD